MAEDQRFTISRSLNGDQIVHIARNASGRIIAREPTLEKLQEAIKRYKEPPIVKEEEAPIEAASAEASEPKKKILTNKLSSAVQKRKEEQEEKSPKKKSFWDKLK